MYSNLEQNPFERQTDLLEQPQIRQEILMIYLASAAMAQDNWKQALGVIASSSQMVRSSRLQKQQALELELQFIQTFCAFKLSNYQKAEKMIQIMLQSIISKADKSQDRSSSSHSKNKSQSQSMGDISLSQFSFKAFAVKVYTLAASLIITQQKSELNFKEIKRGLIRLIEPEGMRQFIPEILGTLTGCKYFKPVVELKNLQHQISNKFAKKLQILADWKFLAGFVQQAIIFKEKAISIWQGLNKHKQLLLCTKQLEQLKKENSKSQYKLRLARIKVFAQPIIKLQPPLDRSLQEKRFNPLIKLYLPVLLNQLKFQSQEKFKPKLSMMSQSSNKKENLLARLTDECELFCQVYKEEIGGEATNLLLNSRFVDEQLKKVRKCLSIFQKIRALRMRQVFNCLTRRDSDSKNIKEAVISKFKTSELL